MKKKWSWKNLPVDETKMKERLDKFRRVQTKINNLKRMYGIDLLQYSELKKKQNNLCAICNRRPITKSLFVDHCHTSGKVRGLLCCKCNTGIGMLEDNIEFLENAIKYLKEHIDE